MIYKYWRAFERVLFLQFARLICLLRLKPKSWLREHQSRVVHDLSYQLKLPFDYAATGKWLYSRFLEPSNDFIEYQPHLPVNRESSETCKLIAFYLPQFHAISENDDWHGRGFTEWTNVTKAMPQFAGHHQPQLPIDVGFYDLSHPKVMHRQIALAKNYGIYGFCFHFYWFSNGRRLLETPLNHWLKDAELDLPFCVNWANENWSKLWDGGNRQILMEQQCRPEDAQPLFSELAPLFADRRYIRHSGLPLLIIYRPTLFSKKDFISFINRLRSCAAEAGFNGLYIMMAYSDNFTDSPTDWGLDGAVEFPPQRLLEHRRYIVDGTSVHPRFRGYVYSLDESIRGNKLVENAPEFPLYRGLFPGWDNTARKAYSNASVYLLSPEMYKRWLRQIINWTRKRHPAEHRYVFINAWNEWAEGAHLEPDQKYGYAYLQATYEALAESVDSLCNDA